MERRFNVYFLIGVFVVVAGILGFYFGISALFRYQLRSVHQVVATDVSVTSEWTELRAEIPMKVEKQTQTVFLVIDGLTQEQGGGFQIELSDGSTVNPEIEVIDESGSAYELKNTTRV